MVRDRFFLSKLSSFALPPAAMSTTLIIYMALNIALVYLTRLSTIVGLMGALVLNLIVLFFIQPGLALPLYIVVAGPTVVLSVISSGILSRLYIGNLLFALIVGIWLLQKGLSERKAGPAPREPTILVPLMCLAFVGLLSILYSHLFPDPHVSYSFAHSNAPLLLVNLVEMSLLISLPLFTVIVPGMVRTARDGQWMLGAYLGIGSLYALGTIFAAPLGLYSQEIILGVRRPQVFGSASSDLGTLNVLFTCLAFGQMLYARNGATRLRLGLLTCIFAIAVVMSFGRESWVGLFLAVSVILGFRFKNPFAFLFPFIVLPLLFLFVPSVLDFFDPSKVYGIDRVNIWQDAIAIWQRSPYMGVGAGDFQFFDLTYGTDIAGVAHNQFLEVLAEMGVQGLICLLLTIIMIGRLVLKRFNAAISSTGKAIALAYLGYFAALLFATFFTSPFIPTTAAAGGTAPFIETSYYWFFLGLVLSIPNWDQEAAASDLAVKLSDLQAVTESNFAWKDRILPRLTLPSKNRAVMKDRNLSVYCRPDNPHGTKQN
jgi:O-antigen ligase